MSTDAGLSTFEFDEARPKGRVASIDVLRGLVMVLMVLDHTRDFIAPSALDPTNVAQASPALFATRWITHFCAPVFALLAGVGAYLAGIGGRAGQARDLALRGLWLVLLELTVVKFGLLFHPAPGFWLAIVLWAIGWSLVVLALLIALGLPPRVIGALGVVMIALHNLADGVSADSLGALRPLWLILHQQGVIFLPGGLVFFVAYPLVPWIGVILAGYGLGTLWGPGWDGPRRRRFLAGLGLALVVGFLGLRALHLYGDPRPWSAQAEPIRTVMSFLNTQKYPPSLQFLAMTLGPAFLLLAWLDARPLGSGVGQALRMLGRVPLFFYVLQWYVIHALAVFVALTEGKPVARLFSPDALTPPAEAEHSLVMVYVAWVVVLLLMYGPCRWFAGLKSRRRDLTWLRYF